MNTVSDVLLKQLLGYLAQTEQFAFFDTSRPCEENSRSYLFVDPVKRLQCTVGKDYSHFLDDIQQWLDRGYHVAGWFGYEFGYLLDKRLHGLTSGPAGDAEIVADLGVFGEPRLFDHESGKNEWPDFLREGSFSQKYLVDNLHPNIEEQEYLDALKQVKEYIAAGDTYQVNLTLKLLFDFVGSPEGLYRELRRNQSVAYGAYIRWGDERVMSFSPELFFRKDPGLLTARPMKGTLRRGRTLKEDQEGREFLHKDGKNRSENVMIVDLLRNDLGRVLHEGGGGEVKVRSLFDVETYESLFQMTSTVHGIGGDTVSSMSLETLFKGLFPCGSVTGAPKIRTMEIIAELEKEQRGPYCGAIGFLAPDGTGVFNVPIRTIVLDGEKGEMGIGSGVTQGSDSGDEWQECLLKGKFLTDPTPEFELIETLFWSPEKGFLYFEEHLSRLLDSADYFYYQADVEAITRQLEGTVAGCTEPSRVRLTLTKDGTVSCTRTACAPPKHCSLPVKPPQNGEKLPVVRLSEVKTKSDEKWLYHKTTRRQIYNDEYARAVERGEFDVLFLNERGELTEGAITNLFIYEDGVYKTPPVSSGLLDGVMRGRLLAAGTSGIIEEVLYPEDLLRAGAVYCCNSVRGVVPVRFSE